MIARLSKMLRGGEISAVELTKLYLSAIEKLNPEIFAYCSVTADYALQSAVFADKLIAENKATPLTGIPMTLKDNICTDGLPTTCCSAILRGFKPYYDAAVWENLKAQGAVLLGKTNMDEFAMGSACESSVYGATKNPRNLNKAAGGSSGGGAAAVCANLAVYALGSDTGGSVRQPASFCGVVGFKPTYGAVSRYGLIAYASSLDQIGPITSSVEDAALVFGAINGADSRDMTCRGYNDEIKLTGDVKGKKIGVAAQFFKGLDGDVKKAAEAAVEKYRAAGAEVVELSLPSLELALPVYYIIACAEASSNLGRYDGIRYGLRAASYSSVDEMILKTRTEGFGKEVQRRIMLGSYVLSSGYFEAYYKKACNLRERIKSELSAAFEKCDFLIAPTAPETAFDSGYSRANPIKTYQSDVCTVPVNCAGLPAVSIPCGTDGAGMPIGLQIIGKPFSDGSVLNFAFFAEKNNLFSLPPFEKGVRL